MSDYNDAQPFPHAIFPDFLSPSIVAAVRREYPDRDDPRWGHFNNAQELKLGGTPEMWGTATRVLADQLASESHIDWLEQLTGIEPLTADFMGGGYHMIPTGGKLALHVDFNQHDDMYRRLNFIVFMNPMWEEKWKGDLILTNRDRSVEKRIAPIGGTAVVFSTSEESFHGHPEPLETPDDQFRCSFACYYYTPQPPPHIAGNHSTIFL